MIDRLSSTAEIDPCIPNLPSLQGHHQAPLARFGVREGPVCCGCDVIGLLTAAAVAFHELIQWLVEHLYQSHDGRWLTPRAVDAGADPGRGGLVVGIITRYIIRSQAGTAWWT
jgi:hypothetical protein